MPGAIKAAIELTMRKTIVAAMVTRRIAVVVEGLIGGCHAHGVVRGAFAAAYAIASSGPSCSIIGCTSDDHCIGLTLLGSWQRAMAVISPSSTAKEVVTSPSTRACV